LVGFAASSPAEKAGSFTLRQAPRTLYKPVGNYLTNSSLKNNNSVNKNKLNEFII
jgi:hypothetical protein